MRSAHVYGLRAHATSRDVVELVRARTALHVVIKVKNRLESHGSVPEPWAVIAERTRAEIEKAAALSASKARRPGAEGGDAEREFVADRIDEVTEDLAKRLVAGDLELVGGVVGALLAIPEGADGWWHIGDRGALRALGAFVDLELSKGAGEAALRTLRDLRGTEAWEMLAEACREMARVHGEKERDAAGSAACERIIGEPPTPPP